MEFVRFPKPDVYLGRGMPYMLSKFCVLIDFDHLKRVPLLKPKPEVDLQLHGRCSENRYDVTRNSAEGTLILMKCGRPMQNNTPMTKIRS